MLKCKSENGILFAHDLVQERSENWGRKKWSRRWTVHFFLLTELLEKAEIKKLKLFSDQLAEISIEILE